MLPPPHKSAEPHIGTSYRGSLSSPRDDLPHIVECMLFDRRCTRVHKEKIYPSDVMLNSTAESGDADAFPPRFGRRALLRKKLSVSSDRMKKGGKGESTQININRI